ncbi:MAG TPA: hypothetical protein VFA09_07720 [Ktedonobacteraceae bacterium]|nr:hypothetical protein [Ktedonobacteraceae bacterium]
MKNSPDTKRNIFLPFLMIASLALLVILLGSILWVVINTVSSGPVNRHATGGAMNLTPTAHSTSTNIPVSPLLFGTNLGLFTGNDQVLTSPTARNLLVQMHIQIIRMPLRSSLSEATEIAAARTIKNLGAVPLVALHGATDPGALKIDRRMVSDMNSIFGRQTVYYEFGNEDDWHGVDATTYTHAWNTVVPQLKGLALNGQFVGPVNYQYERDYLTTFLQHANPRPDEISWHEYPCLDSSTQNTCISHIDDWTTHITDARRVIENTIGTTLPIMITEWNYAPDAVPDDGKVNDAAFMTTWTTRALQTLAANRVFAAMQYSCTNTVISLIDDRNTLTTQGQVVQDEYQRIIAGGQAPALAPSAGHGQYVSFSFEDGSTDGWAANSSKISTVQNSSAFARDGKHSLQVTLSNSGSNDFPYVAVDNVNMANPPGGGQAVSAYLYLPDKNIALSAKIFVMDKTYHWYSAAFTQLQPGIWNHLNYTLPVTINGQPQVLGIQFNSPTNATTSVYIDAVSWT